MDSDRLSALPQAFLHRMKDMLGDDFEPFLAAYEQPRTYGPVSYTHLDVYKRQVTTMSISPAPQSAFSF